MNLYHYCSNSTLVSILSLNTIRASDLTLSNDSLEGKWIRTVVSETCERFGLLGDKRGQFLAHVDGMCDTVSALGFCLSTEGDMLSQWRGYADGGAGISIGFNRPYLELLCSIRPESSPLSMHDVEYNVDAQQAVIKHEIESIAESFNGTYVAQNPFRSETEVELAARNKHTLTFSRKMLNFVPHLFSMKNPAFQEEKECRVISNILRTPDYDKDDARIQYRGAVDRIVPYEDISMTQLVALPIHEIILGPRNITPISVVQGLLRKWNHKNVTVRRSTASFR